MGLASLSIVVQPFRAVRAARKGCTTILIIAFVTIGALARFVRAATEPQTRPSQTFKAGFAERDITPDLGMEQPGGYVKAFHRKFHDACKVRAAVFKDGSHRVVLVGIDALMIRKPTADAAKKTISDRIGIPAEAIMIGASHDHSAGPVGFVLPGEYDSASELVRHLAYDKSSCANADYLAKVEKAIADAVCDADARCEDVRCGVGSGREDSVSFNRRFHMKNGMTFTHPGQGNPDVVEPAGPIDPSVGVIGAWSNASGKLIGCIVNFSCHCTTGPGGTSADYVYYLEQAIRGEFGPDTIVVFLNGASGDITQVDNQSPWALRQGGEANSRKVGGRVGLEAAKVLLSISDFAGAMTPLAYQSRVLDIPRRRPSAEHVQRAMELVSKELPKGVIESTDWIFAKETLLLDAKLKTEPVAHEQVQAIQIGPAVFLACPCEYFCQYGLDIKAASKFPYPMVVSLANDSCGYVPTEEAFGPHGGGYETRLTSHSNLEITAGKQIADALIDLSAQLSPGAMPQPPRFNGTSKPWTYGDLPPQKD